MKKFNMIIVAGFAFRLLQTEEVQCSTIKYEGDTIHIVGDWRTATIEELQLHTGEIGTIHQLLTIICNQLPAEPMPLVKVDDTTHIRPNLDQPVTV